MNKPYLCQKIFLTDWRHKALKNTIDLLLVYGEHFYGFSESEIMRAKSCSTSYANDLINRGVNRIYYWKWEKKEQIKHILDGKIKQKITITMILILTYKRMTWHIHTTPIRHQKVGPTCREVLSYCAA